MRPASIQKVLLPAILVLAIFLRFYQLSAADVISDEAMIAFRSVGYIDYLASPSQPTTWEQFPGALPAWARLSFHDHPPLTFAVQWVSFKIFGVNNFALRFPFALAGVVSVYLVYLITRKLFHETAALSAAAISAIAAPTVWVSRIGLQESLLIFFALISVYWYRRALDDHRFLPAVGFALGLGLLTKYTIIAVALPLLLHFLIYRRDYLRLRTFWLGGLFFGLLSLLVVVYNALLYRMTGHFDLQLSYLLGQKVAAWQSLPGKEQIGSWPERIVQYWTNLSGAWSWPALAIIILSLVLFVWLWFSSADPESSYTLVGLLVLSWGGMLLFIGPSTRFLTPLAVWFLVMVAVVVTSLRSSFPPLRYGLLLVGAGLLVFELLFTVQTVIIERPRGLPGLAYAPLLRSDLEHWGYANLDSYLGKVLAGKRPALSPNVQYPFLDRIQAQAAARAERAGRKSTPLLIIYDANLYNLGALWALHRRLVYEGWPVITADAYLADVARWQQAGIRDYLFIRLEQGMLGEPAAEQTGGAAQLSVQLQAQGVRPTGIFSPRLSANGFSVYRW